MTIIGSGRASLARMTTEKIASHSLAMTRLNLQNHGQDERAAVGGGKEKFF